MVKLDLVIVTYNRIDILKKALSCYEYQTSSFRNLILVDNCSTDGTREYVDEWQKESSSFNKIIIHSEENLGGAGGFYLGQKKAMELDADWVLVADDDAYAEPDMIEKFYHFIEEHDVSKFSAICASVHNPDGTICFPHRSNYTVKRLSFKRTFSTSEDYKKPFFETDLLSYVGSFLNSKALKKVGLVDPRYFIFYDDTEHSVRLKKYGPLLCVSSMVIYHEGGMETKDSEQWLTWRLYYESRNRQRMLFRHYPYVAIVNMLKLVKRYLYNLRQGEAWVYVLKDAYIDACIGRLGCHPVYKPGWKAK